MYKQELLLKKKKTKRPTKPKTVLYPKYLGFHTVGIIASARMELNQLPPAEAILVSFIFKTLKLKIMNYAKMSSYFPSVITKLRVIIS